MQPIPTPTPAATESDAARHALSCRECTLGVSVHSAVGQVNIADAAHNRLADDHRLPA